MVKLCPFCGGKEIIIGCGVDNDTMGVQCANVVCRASIVIPKINKWPEEIPYDNNKDIKENFLVLDTLVLQECINRWNNRTSL